MRTLLATLIAALTLAAPHGTRAAGGCKLDGKQCATNISCCSGHCMKPTVMHGTALFGLCCTPTTCAAAGKNCGMIPDGDCTGFTLSCGTCTAPQTCGGGGTPNVCGCMPATTCPTGDNCGSVPNGCGGTLNCGTCTGFDSCGGGGVTNQCGCTPTTCAAGDCGVIANGCGGMLGCAPCPTTTTTTTLPSCDTNANLNALCTCTSTAILTGNPNCINGQSTIFVHDCALGETCAQIRDECSTIADEQAMLMLCIPGANNCATTPCFDCTTGQQCQ